MRTLGANDALQVAEVFGTDPDLLAMVPQPVHAVLLLYPLSDASEALRASQADELRAAQGAPADASGDDGEFVPKDSGLYWMKQIISNACGTIGLVHAVANVPEAFSPVPGSFFASFLAETAALTPMQRALALEDNDKIEEEHQALAAEAGSDAAHAVNDNLHFVAMVCKNGRLYELDGRKVGYVITF